MDFDFSGVIIFKNDRITHGRVTAHGTGNSSYGAETRAILDGLKEAMSMTCSSNTLVTDCQSFLQKFKQWKKWDTETEKSISNIISNLIKKKIKVTLSYVKAHAENEANNAVDQLINDTWEDQKSWLAKSWTPTTKSNKEVANLVKKHIQLDETTTRMTLRRTQESESSKNIRALNLSNLGCAI